MVVMTLGDSYDDGGDTIRSVLAVAIMLKSLRTFQISCPWDAWSEFSLALQ